MEKNEWKEDGFENERKIIIPTGSDQINIGDNVMVVTMNKGFTEISDILR